MVTVRKAEKSDRDDYLKMRKLLWPECSTDRHEHEIDLILSSSGVVLLAELSQSGVVGFAEVSIRKDHVEGTKESPVPYLEGWYVYPKHQGMGIGKALIKAAEDFAIKMGFNELASDTDLTNESAIEIHKKIGFTEVGRTVHFVKRIN